MHNHWYYVPPAHQRIQVSSLCVQGRTAQELLNDRHSKKPRNPTCGIGGGRLKLFNGVRPNHPCNEVALAARVATGLSLYGDVIKRRTYFFNSNLCSFRVLYFLYFT